MIAFSTAVTSDGQMTVYETGDVNMDGGITASDALATLQNTVGTLDLSKDQKSLADANLDGYVTVTDALLVLQRSVDLLTLPKVKQ